MKPENTTTPTEEQLAYEKLQEKIVENGYKAKLFYQKKQKEHFEKYGCYFDTDSKMGEIIQEFYEQELKENNTIFEFLYNDCIHESAFATVSTHRTKKGAEMAMAFHKNEAKEEWDKDNKELKEAGLEPYKSEFGEHESWHVRETKLLD